MKQVTISVPVALISAANQMMRAAAYGPDDDQTFTAATHSDGTGAEYAVAAGKLDEHVIDVLSSWTPTAPRWGADLALAGQAAGDLVVPDPDALAEGVDLSVPVMVLDLEPQDALTLLGLTRILPPAPEDEPAGAEG